MKIDFNDLIFNLVTLFHDDTIDTLVSVDVINQAKKFMVYESDRYEIIITLYNDIDKVCHIYSIKDKNDYELGKYVQLVNVDGDNNDVPEELVKMYKSYTYWLNPKTSDILLAVISYLKERYKL